MASITLKRGSTTRNRRKTTRNATGEIRAGKPGYISLIPMSKVATKYPPFPPIPGVAYLRKCPPKSRRIIGPFFEDQSDKVTRLAQGCRNRHKLGTLFVAPDNEKGAYSIYKRRAA